jgi:hypothetical protein
MGPNYDYSSKILSPSQLGISGDGNLSALGNDIDGLIKYTEVLVSGGGASKTGRPLGNKFFLPTGQKCKDVDTGEQVTRSIYINNVPDGSIPFISDVMDIKLTEFEGLIPGVVSDLDALNPYNMLQSFLSGSVPDCRSVTLETVDADDNRSNQTAYVTLVDLQNMEGFQNKEIEEVERNAGKVKLFKNKKVIEMIFFLLSIVGIYILYIIMKLERR